MTHTLPIATLLMLGTALSSAAFAQGTTVLQPIVVQGAAEETSLVATDVTSGSKMEADVLDSAASVSVVTSREIATRNADSLEKVLSYSAGVLTDEYGGGDDRYDYIRIRGFSELQLGTYRDGLPVRGFGWTFAPREPYGFERVEVLKGSNSALFGLNAPGGLVNAVTKTPKTFRFGEAYTTLGSGHAEVGTDFGDVLDPAGVWSYRLIAKAQEADQGYDESNDDRRFLAGSLSYRPTDRTELTLMLDYNAQDGTPGKTAIPLGLGIDGDSFLGEPDFNRFDTTERSYGYRFRHDFGNGLTLRQTARYTNIDLDYETVYGATEDETTPRTGFGVYGRNKQVAIDTQLQYDATFGSVKSRTLAGFEYSWIHQHEDARYGATPGIDIFDPQFCGRGCVGLGTVFNDEPIEQWTRAVYLQQELTFADRWILTLGGRYDDVSVNGIYVDDTTYAYVPASNDFSNLSTRIGLTYRIDPALSVYANYSESFEPDAWDVTGEPKEGTQYEVGVKYAPAPDLLITAAAFDLTQTNVSNTTATGAVIRTGEVEVKGTELEAKGALTDRIDLAASWSYWHGEITEDATTRGNRPSFVPRNIVSLWGEYTLPGQGSRGDMTLGLGGRYVSSVFTDTDNSNQLRVGGRTIFDASLRYEVARNVEVQANVDNLFDKRFVSAYDSATTGWYNDEREISATLRYTW